MRKGSKAREAAILETNEWFGGNKPKKISVMKHCRWFIQEVTEWYYNKENKPVDESDHMMENIGRLILDFDFRFTKADQEQEQVSFLDDEEFKDVNYDVGFKQLENDVNGSNYSIY